MAIVIRGLSPCSICNEPVGADDEIVATPHFIHNGAHPLWRYSDSAMHRTCFRNWTQAADFRSAYNTLWNELMPNHPRIMDSDGDIILLSSD